MVLNIDNSSIYQIQNPRWSLHNRFKTWDPKKKILRNFKHEPTLLNRRMVPYEVEIKMVTTAGQSLTCEEKSYFWSLYKKLTGMHPCLAWDQSNFKFLRKMIFFIFPYNPMSCDGDNLGFLINRKKTFCKWPLEAHSTHVCFQMFHGFRLE